jgi:hypothetical protein
MITPKQRLRGISKAALILFVLSVAVSGHAQKHIKQKPHEAASNLPAVLWRDPGNIAALNLIYGAGGRQHAPDPNATYVFEKEDMEGTSPKFDVRDNNGVKWRIKVGAEPQSETAATRLLWAAGYFVDEDYFLAQIKVENLPELRRGKQFVTGGNIVHGVRLKRRDKKIKKIGNWDWFHNRFVGTRELNGLRVMMALINNWDLKEVNNVVYVVDGEQEYLVSDVGASFGRTGNSISRSKSDPLGYRKSNFIQRETAQEVDFEMHSRPFFLTIVNVPNYRERTKMEEVTKHIPRSDAKWLGTLLGRLSEEQVRDCFRSSGYTVEEVQSYTDEVRKRIAELNEL